VDDQLLLQEQGLGKNGSATTGLKHFGYGEEQV
jgi:hypothetical protein